MLTGSTTVLLLDDNPLDLESWSKGLKDCSSNYVIVQSDGVTPAIELCRRQKFDCVVLDLDLPNSSGFEVLFALAPDRRRPETPMIVLTRLVSPVLHRMVLEHGAHACLVKQRTTAQHLHEAVQGAMRSASRKEIERTD